MAGLKAGPGGARGNLASQFSAIPKIATSHSFINDLRLMRIQKLGALFKKVGAKIGVMQFSKPWGAS